MEKENESEIAQLHEKLTHLMEPSQKEEVLRCKPGIHAHPKRPVAEKESRMEMKKETSPFKEALLHFRLESQHLYSAQDLQIQLLFWPGVCKRVQHQGFKGTSTYYIDNIYHQL